MPSSPALFLYGFVHLIINATAPRGRGYDLFRHRSAAPPPSQREAGREPLRLGTSHSLRHRSAVPPPSQREARRGGKGLRHVRGSPGSPSTHRRPRKRAAGSAALASAGCARAGRACRRQWRDCCPGELSPTQSVTERSSLSPQANAERRENPPVCEGRRVESTTGFIRRYNRRLPWRRCSRNRCTGRSNSRAHRSRGCNTGSRCRCRPRTGPAWGYCRA